MPNFKTKWKGYRAVFRRKDVSTIKSVNVGPKLSAQNASI